MRRYRYTLLESGIQNTGTLEVHWEANFSSMSDDYTPDEISAKKLFEKWVSKVRDKHPDGLVHISWFIHVKGDRISSLEFMPFQYFPLENKPKNYLDRWSHPVDCETNEPIDFLSLPVPNKFWNLKRYDKGGFIQQATGWKPSMLQPLVYLPSFTSHF